VPPHRLAVAREVLELRIPPQDVTRPDRRRLDAGSRRAPPRQSQQGVGVGRSNHDRNTVSNAPNAQLGLHLAELTGGTVEETVARVGGGALPLAELPSFACALDESLAAPLRAGDPPVVGIVRDGKLLLDCRTLADDELDEVSRAVAAARP